MLDFLKDAMQGQFSLYSAIAYVVSAFIVIFITMPIHEFAHGFAAVKLGDPTPRYQGRLTLNPFAHIDWLGAAFIILFGFGWAKPVQIYAHNFRKPKRDMAITAFAGPLANIILAFGSLIVYNLFYVVIGFSDSSIVYGICLFLGMVFWRIAVINISLAAFNLIPVPPLDGSRLLAAFLPDRLYYKLMRYEQVIYFALIALIAVGALDVPLSYISSAIFSVVSFIANLPFYWI